MRTTFLSFLMLTVLSVTASSQNVGDTAPGFSFTDLTGNTVTLSQHKGKVVALFIFGYSCPSCIAIAPNVKSKIQDAFGSNNNFVLLGLDQWDGNQAAVESFQSKTGASYPLLQKASSIASLYSTTYDRLIIVNQQGKIAFKGTKLVSSDLDAAVTTISSLLLTTGINEKPADFSVEIYPNPVVSVLNIKLQHADNENVSITLKSILGQTIRTLDRTNSSDTQYSYSFDLEGFASGIYFIEISIGNRKQIFKIVKQQ